MVSRRRPLIWIPLILVAATSILWAGLSAARPAPAVMPQAGAPSVVSYQGKVTVDGSPFDGTGYFKFAVVDAAGPISTWSNDGTSSTGDEPLSGVALPVAAGLFQVLLGDPALLNMTEPLAPSAFEGIERYLRVWFSQDDSSYTLLAPDSRVAAVPYALQAQQASDADTLDGLHATDLAIPPGTMVFGASASETSLIEAGFEYTGDWVDHWSNRIQSPNGRFHMGVAMVDGKIYALGGNSGFDEYTADNEVYDPATGAWTILAPMPTARNGLAAAALDGVIYTIGGRSADTLCETTVEAYYPITNTWVTKAPLPTGRAYLAAVAVAGKVYAIGGASCAGPDEAVVEAYDPVTNSWTDRMAMPTGRDHLAAAVVDGIIYAIGGGWSVSVNEAYDPVANQWTGRAERPETLGDQAAAAVGNLIYNIGVGWWDEQITLVYDPATDSWARRTSMPGRHTFLSKCSAAGVDGTLYVLGCALGGGSPAPYLLAYTPPLYVYRMGEGR